MKQCEGGELGLERFVLRLCRFAPRLPIDLLERLSRELAAQEAGYNQVGGDALIDGGVVAEQRQPIAFFLVDERPACVVGVAICKRRNCVGAYAI